MKISMIPSTLFTLLVLAGMSVLTTACLQVRDDSKTDGGVYGCTFCHELGGGPTHAAHLADAGVRTYGDQMFCEDCHVIPESWFSADGNHPNTNVDVNFIDFASTGGLTPEWNGASCSDVYCHGAGLSGGSYSEPFWNNDLENGIECGFCHGAPPPSPHIDNDDCRMCHGDAFLSDGGLDNRGVHLNGTLDFITQGAK